MKSKLNKKAGLSLMTILFSLFVARQGIPFEIFAGPLPTNVNVSINTDTQVNAYYAGVSGLKGDALLGKLHTIIKDHEETSYSSASLIYKIIERNWDLSSLSAGELSNFDYDKDMPYLRKLYADYNDDINKADLYKNPNATLVSFEKEHIWAQSLGQFGRTYGAGSDLHALWAADTKGNSPAHSNYNFATPVIGITNYNNDHGTYVGRNGYIHGSTEKVFEPLDQYKGDIARAMFYMPARYYIYVDATRPKLQLVNGSPAALTASPSQPGLAGDLATLLEWNKLDPVDDYEIRRNNLIYNNYQGNRNPFIDHPEWADIAYDTSYDGIGANIGAETSSVGTNPAWQSPEKLMESISLNTSSAQLSFEVGESFELDGLIVTAHYDDESSKEVFSYSSSIQMGYLFEETGSISVTISYTEFGVTETASYSISVVAATKNLTHISLNTATVQTTFKFKEDFNYDNLIVTAHYDDSSNKIIGNYSISTPSMDAIGNQSISISFLGKTSSYSILVTNNNADFGTLIAGDLFISEYVLGTSYNKYIEIYNGTGFSVNLSDYWLRLYSNGASTPNNNVRLSGTLEHKSTIVYKHSSATLSLPNGVTEIANAAVNFNGDDAVALWKASTETFVDIFGVIGQDPGTAWTGGGSTTSNKTLVRKANISSGVNVNPVFLDSNGNDFDPSIEWNTYVIDTATYLGAHTMNNITASDALEQSIAYAKFFLEVTAPYCEVLNGGSVDWSYLSNEYSYMANLSKDRFYSESIEDDIAAAKERYQYLIEKYPTLASNNFIKNSAGNPYLSTSVPSVSTMDHYSDKNVMYWMVSLIVIISSLGVIFYLKKQESLS